MDSKSMYVIEPGCVVKKRGLNFYVTKNNEKLIDIPYSKIERIFLVGSQSITPQAMEFALEKEKDILFLNTYGNVKGVIKSSDYKNVYLRLAQYETWRDKEKRLNFAKSIVKGKINNQNRLLKKYKKEQFNITNINNKIHNTNEMNILLGIEGEASRNYFSNFDSIILGDLKFEKRSRQPPKNEFNALLSLTYTLTKNNILIALEKESLDSHIGYLHSVKYGRESLALDILEEFRPLCDHLVIKWINRKEFKSIDFIRDEEGIWLRENSFRKYLEKYNNEYKSNIENKIEKQISLLKKSILEDAEYTSFQLCF